MKFDTLQRMPVLVQFWYADGSVREWPFQDIYAPRPKTILFDGGEALIEDVQEVRLIWLGDPGKCTNWDYLLEIHGCYEVPESLRELPVVRVESQFRPAN
jgi:hypothetical protein